MGHVVLCRSPFEDAMAAHNLLLQPPEAITSPFRDVWLGARCCGSEGSGVSRPSGEVVWPVPGLDQRAQGRGEGAAATRSSPRPMRCSQVEEDLAEYSSTSG